MRRVRSTFWLAVVAGALGACADQPVAPADVAHDTALASRQASPGRPLSPSEVGSAVPDRYVVVFKKDVRDVRGLAARLVNAHGGSLHYVYDAVLGGFAATLPPQAAEALRRNPQVERVTPDGIVGVGTTQLGATWGIDRIDQRARPLDSEYNYVHTGSGVRAYIIDSGIYYGHQDFGGRASFGYDTFGGNGGDCDGHGTHVAGTVGGGTWGVAKNVGLVSVRVLNCSGGGSTSGVIAGIDWVADNHVKPAVANFSIRALDAAGNETTDPDIDQALRDLVALGVTTVVAAGNQNRDACTMSPGRVTEALVVGASTSSDARASFSNRGTCLDLFAPGNGITSAGIANSTDTENLSGTSMAAPHVTGVAAMVLSLNPTASPASVQGTITGTSTPGRLSSIGTGSPNVLLSLPTVVTLNGGSSIPLGLSSYGCYTINTLPSWQAAPAGGNGTYTYLWEKRYRSYGSTSNWFTVGTSQSYTWNLADCLSGDFDLRVTTSSGGYSATDLVSVYLSFYVM